jgi:hypothetical protein
MEAVKHCRNYRTDSGRGGSPETRPPDPTGIMERLPIALIALFVVSGLAAADLTAQMATQLDRPTQEWNEQFGAAVAISGDRAVVAAPYDRSLLGSQATGAVYVYRQGMDGWSLEDVLYPYGFPELSAEIEFGRSVSIDGDLIAVGAAFEPLAAYQIGSVYVFRHDGEAWQAEAKLTVPPRSSYSRFGYAVAVSGDRVVATEMGIQVSTGTSTFNCLNQPREPGRAVVFRRGAEGRWVQEAIITPIDGLSGTGFGNSVAFEAGRIAVGAYRWYEAEICDNLDHNRDGIIDGHDRGKVYVYRLDEDGWTGEAEIQPKNVADGDQFGFSVAISGQRIIAGAPYTDEVGRRYGAAYTYTLNGSEWTFEEAFAGNDTNPNDRFGYAVALDGEYAVIGAPRHRNADLNVGAMYAFRRAGGGWEQGIQITVDEKTGEFSDPGPLMFGEAVAVTPIGFVIGAPQDPRIAGEIAGVMVGSAWTYTVAEVFAAPVSADPGLPERVVSRVEAFPNPTTGQATISFELSAAGSTHLALFDVLGRRVLVLTEGERLPGRHRIEVDLSHLAAGVYTYRLEAQETVLTGRLVRR